MTSSEIIVYNIDSINKLLNETIYSDLHLDLNPNLNQIIDHIKRRLDLLFDNVFFSKLIKNQMELSEFVKYQEPFFWAVKKWGSVMSDCIYLESDQTIKNVYQKNWSDEFGLEDQTHSHVNTFIQYLKEIGHTGNNICNKTKSVIDFEMFLDSVVKSTTNERLLTFGTIELTYVFISHIIHNYVSNKNGAILDVHYSLHELLDVKHSIEFFNNVSNIDFNVISNTMSYFIQFYTNIYCETNNFHYSLFYLDEDYN